jgi:hypothetical protein
MRLALSYALLLFVASCAQESKVEPLFPAVRINESHGDGNQAVFTVKIPLSENSIDDQQSPIDPDTGIARVPLLGEILRLVGKSTMNFALGTKLADGERKLTIKQGLPDLNEPVLKHISIKRLFFHIAPKNPLERPRREFILFRWFRRLLRGNENLDFKFIQSLVIEMRMERAERPVDSYLPCVVDEAVRNGCPRGSTVDEKGKALPRIKLIEYQTGKRAQQTNDLGSVLIAHTDRPVRLRQFLRSHPAFDAVVKDITLINKNLVIELRGDRLAEEKFYALLERFQDDMADLEIPLFTECENFNCMDLRVGNENLLPMLQAGDLLNIQTNMALRGVPNRNFQLKGFIEFEVKVDAPL